MTQDGAMVVADNASTPNPNLSSPRMVPFHGRRAETCNCDLNIIPFIQAASSYQRLRRRDRCSSYTSLRSFFRMHNQPNQQDPSIYAVTCLANRTASEPPRFSRNPACSDPTDCGLSAIEQRKQPTRPG